MIALTVAAFLVLSPADLQEIGRVCHAPANWVTMKGEHWIYLDPPATAEYVQVDCILHRIKVLGETRGETPDLGFVGNEKAN